MSSTWSNLGLRLMATGENDGTWGAQTNDNLNILKQLIVICKKDIRVSTPMVIFCMKVWAHQFYFNSLSIVRISLGKWKSKFSHTI